MNVTDNVALDTAQHKIRELFVESSLYKLPTTLADQLDRSALLGADYRLAQIEELAQARIAELLNRRGGI